MRTTVIGSLAMTTVLLAGCGGADTTLLTGSVTRLDPFSFCVGSPDAVGVGTCFARQGQGTQELRTGECLQVTYDSARKGRRLIETTHLPAGDCPQS